MTSSPVSRPRARRWSLTATLVVVLSTGALAAGSALVVGRASAALQQVAETGRPGYLVLRSDPGVPQWQDLSVGDTVHWLVEASLENAERSSLRLELRADGTLIDAGGMTAEVVACSVPFLADGDLSVPQPLPPECPGEESSVLPRSPLGEIARSASGDLVPLADLRRDAPRHLRVTLSLSPAASGEEIARRTARIGVGLHAAGDDPGELGVTGEGIGSDLVAVLVLGTGLIGLGAGLALRRRAQQERTAEEAAS